MKFRSTISIILPKHTLIISLKPKSAENKFAGIQNLKSGGKLKTDFFKKIVKTLEKV